MPRPTPTPTAPPPPGYLSVAQAAVYLGLTEHALRARLALAERRRTLIERMNAEKAALHAMSKEMIMGLQQELQAKQERDRTTGAAGGQA